jgi:hypothetical protein
MEKTRLFVKKKQQKALICCEFLHRMSRRPWFLLGSIETFEKKAYPWMDSDGRRCLAVGHLRHLRIDFFLAEPG